MAVPNISWKEIVAAVSHHLIDVAARNMHARDRTMHIEGFADQAARSPNLQ